MRLAMFSLPLAEADLRLARQMGMTEVDIAQVVRCFGGRKKIFFAHFRDIRGSMPIFEKAFHDEGKTGRKRWREV